MAELNESSEIVAMKNLLLQSKEILKKSIDFTVKTGEPKIYLTSENPNDYDIELNITCTLNDNIEVFNSYFKETLGSIKMSEGEIEIKVKEAIDGGANNIGRIMGAFKGLEADMKFVKETAEKQLNLI